MSSVLFFFETPCIIVSTFLLNTILLYDVLGPGRRVHVILNLNPNHVHPSRSWYNVTDT